MSLASTGGAAALTCGPACASAAAGAASSYIKQSVDIGLGNQKFDSAGDVIDGALNIAFDASVGALTGEFLSKKLTPFMKKSVSSSVKGDIGEGLTALRLVLSGKFDFQTQVKSIPNRKTTFDFLLNHPDAKVREFVEAKFGTADLSKIQRLASKLSNNNVTVDSWTYDIFWGMIGAGLSAGLVDDADIQILGGGYAVGDIFALQ